MAEQPRMSRRAFLAAAGLAGAAVAGDAALLEPAWLDVTRHRVPVSGLPRALEGFTVAHVTDVHLDSIGRLHETMLAEIQATDCQLVAITGDMIDNRDALDEVAELCSRLSSACPRVIAGLGNWEYWSKVRLEAIDRLYARSGVTLVVDDVVDAGVVVGVTNDGATLRADFERTIEKLPRAVPASLLLTHAPGPIPHVARPPRPFDLVLSGHTHGGQIQLFDTPLWTPEGSGDFVAGWYDDTPLGRTYVSRGLGMTVLDVRFMCRPELAFFEFTRA